MTTELVAILVASFLTSFGSIIVAIITNRGAAHKSDVNALAETVKTLQDENARLVTENRALRQRLDELEAKNEDQERRIEQLEDENGDLQAWTEALVTQIESMEKTPVQPPKRRRKVT